MGLATFKNRAFIMQNIRIVHLDKHGAPIGESFVKNLKTFKSFNKDLDWDHIISVIILEGSYTTVNMPYGNITISFE